MLIVSILSLIVGISLGSFLTFQILLSYDEAIGCYDIPEDIDYAALAGNAEPVSQESEKRIVGDTDEIRAIFAKRRQAGR